MKFWLVRKEFWRTLAISIRRFPRDKRARRFVFVLIGSLLYVGFYLRFFIGPFFFTHTHDSQAEAVTQLVIATILLAGALLVYLMHRWLERRDRTPSILGETASPAATTGSQLRHPCADQLWRDAIIVAALLQRGGSESAMQTTVLAPGKQIITRQWQRERLLALGLWNDLPVIARDLLLLPDGHWSTRQGEAVAHHHEHFFVLRWALELDAELRPLDRLPSYPGKSIVATLADARPASFALRDSWDMRAARDEAYGYFDRFWLEAVARRLMGQQLEEAVLTEASHLKAEIDANRRDSTDLLVGTQTVSELDDPTLMTMALTSYRRWTLLELLTRIATTDAQPAELHAMLFDSLASELQPEEAS